MPDKQGRCYLGNLPRVRADFYLDGSLAHSVNIAAKAGPIPMDVDESSLSSSVNQLMPAEVIQPGLELVVEIDPDETLDKSLGVARRVPETGRMAIEVRAMPRFDITFIPFIWDQKPDMEVVDLVEGMRDDPEGHPLLKEIRRLLPINEIEVTAHEPVRSSTNEASALKKEASLIATMEGIEGYVMGLLSGEFSGAAGIAELGRLVTYSVADATVMAHELGHNFSLQHAPCGRPLGIEPAYPYPNASVGVWGYDFDKEALVSPTEYFDPMAYCSPNWMSDFGFDRMLRYRLNRDGLLAPTKTAPVASLVIWGGVDGNAKPFLEPALFTDAPPSLPESGKRDHRITGYAVDGTSPFHFAFGMPVALDGNGSASFAFAVPIEPQWSRTLASVRLEGPGGSVITEHEAAPPIAVLRDAASGQVTRIVRDPQVVDALRGSVQPGLISEGIPVRDAWQR